MRETRIYYIEPNSMVSSCHDVTHESRQQHSKRTAFLRSIDVGCIAYARMGNLTIRNSDMNSPRTRSQHIIAGGFRWISCVVRPKCIALTNHYNLICIHDCHAHASHSPSMTAQLASRSDSQRLAWQPISRKDSLLPIRI